MLPVTTIPGNWSPLGSGTRRGSSLSPRGKAQNGKVGGATKKSPVKQREALDTFCSICISPECPAAGCAWLHAYVGACSAQGALAASMLFQANGKTLRWSTLGPIIGGNISLMDRETAYLAPFHWFRPTKGSLDSQQCWAISQQECVRLLDPVFLWGWWVALPKGFLISLLSSLTEIFFYEARKALAVGPNQGSLMRGRHTGGPGAIPKPSPCRWVQVNQQRERTVGRAGGNRHYRIESKGRSW